MFGLMSVATNVSTFLNIGAVATISNFKSGAKFTWR